MVAAVEKAGLPNMVWYNYRRIPSVTLAKNIIDRKEFEGESKLLEKGTWDGVVDTVGGVALTKIFAQAKPGGIVAACGNAGGIKINTTVMPFIIRGVKLWGIDSVMISKKRREFIWSQVNALVEFAVGLSSFKGNIFNY